MSRNDLLLVAAVIVAVAGFVHSYLGERLVFPRLFALADLPLLRRDRIYTENVLRYAWHVTSLACWAAGAILIAFWWGATDARHTALLIIAAMLLLTGLIVLATAGRRHPAWPLFLIAAAAAWYGA
jgi:hypothetical protein